MKFAGAVLCLSGFFAAWGQKADVQAVPHVIIVGVDGMSVEGVATAKTPRIHELMARGAWTLEARGVMPTLSAPNWASMITGAGPEQHGITSNGVLLQKMVTLPAVCRDAEGMFPTMFEVLRMQRPASHIAIFHDWPGFADLVEKHAPDIMEHERGAERTTQAAIDYWKQNRPELMFVHLDNVDHTGHEYGWGSHEYNKAVADADGYVGRFVDMLKDAGRAGFHVRAGDQRSRREGPRARQEFTAGDSDSLDSGGSGCDSRPRGGVGVHVRYGGDRGLDFRYQSAGLLDWPAGGFRVRPGDDGGAQSGTARGAG